MTGNRAVSFRAGRREGGDGSPAAPAVLRAAVAPSVLLADISAA